jgi:hypothetical protein
MGIAAIFLSLSIVTKYLSLANTMSLTGRVITNEFPDVDGLQTLRLAAAIITGFSDNNNHLSYIIDQLIYKVYI